MYSDIILRSDIDHLIVKHNELVQAKTKLSESEQKLISLAIVLTRIYALDKTKNMSIDSAIRIHAREYMLAYGVSIQTAYSAINEAMSTLYERSFTTKSSTGKEAEYRWVQSKAISKPTKLSDGFVEFEFSNKAIELILDINNGNYTSYGIERISRLNGNYAGRLYEIAITVKHQANKTTRIYPIEELRLILGVEDDEYRDKSKPNRPTRMDNFKKYVIEETIKKINKETDIKMEAMYFKTGRNISGIAFSFKFKKNYQPKFNNLNGREVLVSGIDDTDTIKTVGDETKPKDAPDLPTVKDDKEHLGTDLRTEDLKDKVNPVQDHIVDFKDLVKPVPADKKKELDVHSIPGHLYSKYEEVGGTLSIEKLTEKCRASTKTAGHFMLTEIAELKKQA